MDCSFGQICSGEARACKQPLGKLTVPLAVNGVPVSTLIDLRCGQTLICQDLALPPDLPLVRIQIQCIHGDVRPYPKAQVILTMNGERQAMMVGLAPRLVYPVILGRDWKGFTEVLWATTARGPHSEIALKGEPIEEANRVSEDPDREDRWASDPNPDLLKEEVEPGRPDQEETLN